MKKNSSILIGLLYVFLTVILVIIDQFTKHLAVIKLKGNESYILIKGIFELHYLENRGAAFGILQNQKIFFIIITVLLIALLVMIFVRMPMTAHFRLMRFVITLFLAGAIGNLIDRCMHDYVVDFFYFVLIDFPIFNVADIYVVVAAILFVVVFLFYYKEDDFKQVFPYGRHKN